MSDMIKTHEHLIKWAKTESLETFKFSTDKILEHDYGIINFCEIIKSVNYLIKIVVRVYYSH